MNAKAKDTYIITRDDLQRIIRSHTLKPLVKRISKILQLRSKGDIYIRDLMFRKSIHPEYRYFRNKWELALFLRKKILTLKNTLLPIVQKIHIENAKNPIEEWMAAIIIYTQQKELYPAFYYLRKIDIDIKKSLLEIKKLRRQIAIYQSFEVPCDDLKIAMKNLLNKYEYYVEEKKQVMKHVKKIEYKVLDKWLFYNGHKELYGFRVLKNGL
jgi:hypothetical protein